MDFCHPFQQIDSKLTLRNSFTFDEEEYQKFQFQQSKDLMNKFLELSIVGITVAFMSRVVLMENNKTVLDLVLPFIIFSVFLGAFTLNKVSTIVKRYFHVSLVPLVGFLVARKTISQNESEFYMNSCFTTWTVMMIYLSFISPMEWHKITLINLSCVLTYITTVIRHYGYLSNDFYIHIPTSFILLTILVRLNEQNLRNSFNLLHISKQNENQWLRVLSMLTDGVLVLQNTDNDDGILLLNQSLRELFKEEETNNKEGQKKDNCTGCIKSLFVEQPNL